MNDIKEKYLLFRAKSFNDTEAYGQIYDRYVERIYRFIFFKVGSKADAEDITSEAFLKTWQYIKEGKPIKNLNAFLYAVARNLVVDHYRTQARKYDTEEGIVGDIRSDANIAGKMELKSDAEQILRAMRTLKDEYCEVIVLRFLDDLSIGDIAKIIDKTSNNTRVLVHRALGALKKSLDPDANILMNTNDTKL
ncbi:RNA polymerase sigma factor [Patescibacteria group bacterium]|nr:RNA polymerase sigma factor [Patescibacteria group bacterium]